MNGYILESRTIVNSPIWDKPPLYFKVWHYLLLRAQHSDYKGLKRGQLITSIPEIQEACSYYVGYRKVKPTKKEIYGIVNFFRNPYEGDDEGNNEGSMIVTTKVTHGMLVTICNYNVYQDPKFYEGNNEGTTKVTAKELRRERQGNNINKNVLKNDKKERERDALPLVASGRKKNVFLTADEKEKIKTTFENHNKLINKIGDIIANSSRNYPDHDALLWKIAEEDGWPKKKKQHESARELTKEEKDAIRAQEAEWRAN